MEGEPKLEIEQARLIGGLHNLLRSPKEIVGFENNINSLKKTLELVDSSIKQTDPKKVALNFAKAVSIIEKLRETKIGRDLETLGKILGQNHSDSAGLPEESIE